MTKRIFLYPYSILNSHLNWNQLNNRRSRPIFVVIGLVFLIERWYYYIPRLCWLTNNPQQNTLNFTKVCEACHTAIASKSWAIYRIVRSTKPLFCTLVDLENFSSEPRKHCGADFPFENFTRSMIVSSSLQLTSESDADSLQKIASKIGTKAVIIMTSRRTIGTMLPDFVRASVLQ
jgi:hypothetical protein